MKQCNNVTMNQKGFTLLEVMVAIFVITVGVIGVLSALQRATSATFVSSSRLEAIYLAQEGIEIVRNIRDTNWLNEGVVWDSGLPTSPPDYRVDYRNKSLFDVECEGIYLKIDGEFYECSSESGPKKLQRKITISHVDLDGDGEPDKMSVSVTVEWEERGENFQVRVQENLYNWK